MSGSEVIICLIFAPKLLIFLPSKNISVQNRTLENIIYMHFSIECVVSLNILLLRFLPNVPYNSRASVCVMDIPHLGWLLLVKKNVVVRLQMCDKRYFVDYGC